MALTPGRARESAARHRIAHRGVSGGVRAANRAAVVGPERPIDRSNSRSGFHHGAWIQAVCESERVTAFVQQDALEVDALAVGIAGDKVETARIPSRSQVQFAVDIKDLRRGVVECDDRDRNGSRAMRGVRRPCVPEAHDVRVGSVHGIPASASAIRCREDGDRWRPRRAHCTAPHVGRCPDERPPTVLREKVRQHRRIDRTRRAPSGPCEWSAERAPGRNVGGARRRRSTPCVGCSRREADAHEYRADGGDGSRAAVDAARPPR